MMVILRHDFWIDKYIVEFQNISTLLYNKNSESREPSLNKIRTSQVHSRNKETKINKYTYIY